MTAQLGRYESTALSRNSLGPILGSVKKHFGTALVLGNERLLAFTYMLFENFSFSSKKIGSFVLLKILILLKFLNFFLHSATVHY